MTRLVLRAEPPVRIAVDGLTPERLAGRSAGEIERLPLKLGNRSERVGDWFGVTADGDMRLVIGGPGHRLDRIGAGMAAGEIVVAGDAGAYLGLAMRGGRILVEGSAGYGLATDLREGRIEVRGDAGAAVGGALPGAASGMRGGTVLIGGSAGGRVGHRLARGMIVVAGSAGSACGAEMRAGTVIAGGELDDAAAVAMRRGTIICLGAPPRLGPGFVDTGAHELVFLRLLARELAAVGRPDLALGLRGLRRFVGDHAVRGKGEIFTTS
jgi:formylmethanofuran dehydrogenase subunit C